MKILMSNIEFHHTVHFTMNNCVEHFLLLGCLYLKTKELYISRLLNSNQSIQNLERLYSCLVIRLVGQLFVVTLTIVLMLLWPLKMLTNDGWLMSQGFLRSVSGLSLDSLWTVSGLSLDCLWTVSGLSLDCCWTVSRLCLDCFWTVAGLLMDCL